MREILLFVIVIALIAGCGGSSDTSSENVSAVVSQSNSDLSGAVTSRMEAWADN